MKKNGSDFIFNNTVSQGLLFYNFTHGEMRQDTKVKYFAHDTDG